jgi:hypothetical protein
MGLDFEMAKAALVRALRSPQVKVIALSGKWGTGKTHLWNEGVLKSPDLHHKKGPLYVSLFGVRTLDDLKLKLLDSCLSVGDSRDLDLAKNTAKTVTDLVAKKWPSVAAVFSMKPLLLASANYLIANRIVVIDDIERKHTTFDIQEILGFIMEHAERHETRFVLLLNLMKLSDEASWDELREKVLDVEILLDPKPSSALNVAFANVPNSPYRTEIENTVRSLGINNIRVLRRIIRAVTELLGDDGGLSESVRERTIPRVVLLTAAYLQAVPGGPPVSFIQNFNAVRSYLDKGTDRTAGEITWESTMHKLGITSTDAFEQIVGDYLSNGYVDQEKLSSLINHYRGAEESTAARERISDFVHAYLWDGNKSAAEIVAKAETLLADVGFMTPNIVSQIAQIAVASDGALVGDSLVARWIEFFNDQKDRPARSDPFQSPTAKIDPRVNEAMDRWQADRTPALTLSQATSNAYANSGYGDLERAAFRSATAESYASTLDALQPQELQDFLTQHYQFMNTGGLDEDITSALPKFVAGCELVIAKSGPERRIGEILRRERSRNLALIQRVRERTTSPTQPQLVALTRDSPQLNASMGDELGAPEKP